MLFLNKATLNKKAEIPSRSKAIESAWHSKLAQPETDAHIFTKHFS